MILALLLAAAPVPAASDIRFTVDAPGRATLTTAIAGETGPREIATIDQALAVLADTRFATVWPAVSSWAGPGMTQLRDAGVAEGRAAVARGKTREARTGGASSVRPQLRATFLLADTLWAAGERDAAIALLRQARGSAPAKGSWGRTEWTITSSRLAQMLAERGDFTGAIALLDASIAPLGDVREASNIEINRAALLAQSGHAAEALAAIDAAQARFDGPAGGGSLFAGNVRIRGSDRQFAWIRACALARLGRTAEATAAAAPLRPAVEPADKRFVIAPTIALREQLARCSGDVAGAAAAYAEELRTDPPGGTALLELQPALVHPRFDPAFMAAVRRHPALAPLLAERMRVLPANLVPALNGWPDAAAK